jgi:mannose/cellobiose epimerase-like protein (N-acyl-D-glucosamine 2-epimerase family)/mannose-1-phosphate guanylyltransferase
LFQDAVLRTRPLAQDGGQLIVIGGEAHRSLIVDQLAEIETDACVLLEPEPRDSAPAIAAATAHVLACDPDAILALVASDHHIPDDALFRDAVQLAAQEAGRGRIVTLGVKPTHPSTAYGYIKPAAPGLSRVDEFVEKPDPKRAASLIAQGYLWNSGNLISSAKVLDDELRQLAPAVHSAAARSFGGKGARVRVLGDGFRAAPRVSIDYAVMEKTRLASVLEVDFAWSDLGTWDAMSASGEGGVGLSVLEDAENCLTRAPDGVLVAAMGVKNLAIIVEPDAVLVSDLSQSVNLKRLMERVAATSPKHLDQSVAAPQSFASEAEGFARWLRLRALPVWSTIGMNAAGAFAETISLDGEPLSSFRRARVQARQIYVYSQAGLLGWDGPWRETVEKGIEELNRTFRRPDGLYRARVDEKGVSLDDTVTLYDQAFVMLALATARKAGLAPGAESEASVVRDALLARAGPNGAMVEVGEQPYQANAHMHLFEAFQAWEEVGEDAKWARASDQVADLARTVLFDPVKGCLREFFGADWTAASGEDGKLVEPGHQFEWASLLFLYGLKRRNEVFSSIARELHAFGRRGIADRGGYVLDALNDDGSVRSRRARLWPQSEWLRASLLLAEHSPKDERVILLNEAGSALSSLARYLTPDGLWNDKQLEPGDFLEEPAPASSFYHIMSAFSQLEATSGSPGFEGWGTLRLGGSRG